MPEVHTPTETQHSCYLPGLDTTWTDIFTVGGIQDARDGRLAMELSLAASAEAQDCIAAPPYAAPVVLG